MRATPLACALALATSLSACHRDTAPAGADAAPAANGGAAATSATPSGPGPECLAQLDFLVPYQAYKNADVIHSITVDGDQVFFRTADDVFRVPLAGGAVAKISSAAALTLQFDSHPSIWVVGDKLVTQSPGEPIFLESPKAGGPWSPLVNLTNEKINPTMTTGQKVVHDIFAQKGARAHPAIFDGTSFYWVEVTSGSKGKKSSSFIRSAPLSGGAARTLYEWDGGLRALAKAGDRLVFMRTDPAPEAQKEPPAAGHAKARAQAPLSAPVTRPTFLMSMPLEGGKPESLARFGSMGGNLGRGEVQMTDGDVVYLSGFEDEDFMKAGLFRISASGASRLERIDERSITGEGFVYGDRIVLVGAGPIEPRSKQHVAGPNDMLANMGTVVLTGERHGKTLDRAACIRGNHTTHAYAVAGKTLLISIFNDDDKRAAIVRVPLP